MSYAIVVLLDILGAKLVFKGTNGLFLRKIHVIKSGHNFEIWCILLELGYKKYMFGFARLFLLLVMFFSMEIFWTIHSISIKDIFIVRREMHTFFTIKCYIVTQLFNFQVFCELQQLYIIILSPFCINMFNKGAPGHNLIHFDSN